MRLQGKIGIVTGGLSGIGQAVAARMAAEGAVVVAADITAAETVLTEGRVVPFRVDVSDPDSVARLVTAVVARHGGIDFLVNSAGVAQDTPFLETGLTAFDRIIAVNLRGTFIVGQAVAAVMRRAGSGSIVNIASVSGMVGNVGRAAYGASKGGVVILSQVMAVDLAQYGIRVNVLAPGPIDTPMVGHLHDPAIRERWLERTPLHRYAQPEEMAGAVVFLCSLDASFVTGHVLAADGGLTGSGLAVPMRGDGR